MLVKLNVNPVIGDTSLQRSIEFDIAEPKTLEEWDLLSTMLVNILAKMMEK